MKNGSNEFGVSFAQISWFDKLLSKHPNVSKVKRVKDIVFEVARKKGTDVNVICVDEYTCGLSRVFEILDEFPEVNMIYVGGIWNGYTREAKEFCIGAKIGLYNASEMNGALHDEEFWSYYQRDKDGSPKYPYQAA